MPDGTSYVNPVFTADHKWLHLEARYNDEELHTGSLWIGYNFSRGDLSEGDKWAFSITPMIGGVFGRTDGIALGCEASLNYRNKVETSINSEYLFDTSKSGKLLHFLAATLLLAGGMVSCGGGGATYRGLPHSTQHPAGIPGGPLTQKVGTYHLCVRSGVRTTPC
jgi:hypothetical protein